MGEARTEEPLFPNVLHIPAIASCGGDSFIIGRRVKEQPQLCTLMALLLAAGEGSWQLAGSH